MEALSATAASANPAATSVVPSPLPRPAQPAPEPLPAPVAAPPHPQALPALPAAVQRTHLDVPAPKLMTREQMAAILELTT